VQALVAPNFYWLNAPMLFLMALAIGDALPGVAAWIDRTVARHRALALAAGTS
jgi:hypothetical protein